MEEAGEITKQKVAYFISAQDSNACKASSLVVHTG
jgi:hypothetical protein